MMHKLRRVLISFGRVLKSGSVSFLEIGGYQLLQFQLCW